MTDSRYSEFTILGKAVLLKPIDPNRPRVDLSLRKYGKLSFLKYLGSTHKGIIYADMLCDCGMVATLAVYRVICGNTKSCGCLKPESTTARNISSGHPLCHHPLFGSWRRMIQRCTDVNCDDYKDYGGRGINVCERWMAFENFLEDMGDKPSKSHSIERNDVDGMYELLNCRWATNSEQQRNKRNNHKITYEGVTKTLAEWCEIYEIEGFKVRYRLKHLWPMDKLFTQ